MKCLSLKASGLLILILPILASAAPVSQPQAQQPVPVACLNHEGAICRLVSPTVALSVTVKNGDADIQFFAPAADGFVERAHTKLRSDLEAKVVGGTMGENEAAQIFSEILANPYVAYKLPPNSETLNQEVGFDPNVQLSPQDQIEVLRAHLQMSLSVSAVTSRYLSDGLGLQVIEPMRPVNKDDPNLITESQVLLATPTEEAAPVSAPPDVVQPPEAPEALPAPLPEPLKTNPPTERITGATSDQTQS